MNFKGYLKGYPGDDTQSQIDFAAMLAKYGIDFIEFEHSFRKDQVGEFPRKLNASDIKQSTWLYSQALNDTILSNNFLKERLSIDPSVLIDFQTSKETRNR